MTATGKIELRMQKYSPLAGLGYFEVDRSKVFRKSTDAISAEAQQRIDAMSKL